MTDTIDRAIRPTETVTNNASMGQARLDGVPGTGTRQIARGVQGDVIDVLGVTILDELEISKAHVVGDSTGALIALELAMQASDRLLSAVLFESLLEAPPEEWLAPILAKAESGDFEGAAADLLAPLRGSREVLKQAVPGSWADIVKDAPTFSQLEMPALGKWKPDPAKIGAIKVPLAVMVATGSDSMLREGRERLQEWLPALKPVDIPADDHAFPLKAAADAASAIADWIESI